MFETYRQMGLLWAGWLTCKSVSLEQMGYPCTTAPKEGNVLPMHVLCTVPLSNSYCRLAPDRTVTLLRRVAMSPLESRCLQQAKNHIICITRESTLKVEAKL
jgi:hypothetical protein